MLNPLQNYFHYSRGERRGTVALLIIIVILLSYYFVSDLLVSSDVGVVDADEFKERIAAFEEGKVNHQKTDSITFFMFDPNLIRLEDWMALGFSEKQAQSIENYKSSGATFKIKKDVLKLFMVDEYKYTQLEPYIDLPDDYPTYDYSNDSYQDNEYEEKELYAILIVESDKPIYDGFEKYDNVHYTKKNDLYQYLLLPYQSKELAEKEILNLEISSGEIIELTTTKGYYPVAAGKKEKASKFEKLSIDLNNADTTELKKLYGIGSGYAKRIVNYREALGGYVNLNQLSEVYGLKQETIDKIIPELHLGNFNLTKLDVNSSTLEELKAHPYIDWKVANSIVEIRNNYGKFASIEGIKKSVLIDEKLFQKLKPYIEAK